MSIDKFVDVSRENGYYFANRDGSTYLPIGLNLCFYRNSENVPEETVLETYRRWFTNKECICYFPWDDTHATAKIDHGWAILPEFKRSLVVKLLK